MEPICTVSIGGNQFLVGNRGLVNYEAPDGCKRPFRMRVQENDAAFEARIAQELGLAAGTPQVAVIAECATHAENSASSRLARPSGDKAKRSTEVHTGAREPSRHGDGGHPDETMPPPAQRRSPGPSSLFVATVAGRRATAKRRRGRAVPAQHEERSVSVSYASRGAGARASP